MSRKQQKEIATAQKNKAQPIKGPAETPEEMQRKGDFLVRQFGNPQGPLLDKSGKSTLLALSAKDWGEQVPKNEAAAHRLAKKGQALLKHYHQNQKRREAA